MAPRVLSWIKNENAGDVAGGKQHQEGKPVGEKWVQS